MYPWPYNPALPLSWEFFDIFGDVGRSSIVWWGQRITGISAEEGRQQSRRL